MSKKHLNEYEKIMRDMGTRMALPESTPYQWKEVDPEEKGKQKVLYGLCRACMQGDCGTLVTLEDGVVTKIEGNPETPSSYGSLCGKGRAEIMGHYNPYRVKTPLVRTNPEKGLDVDPMWREATWDEALDIVAERLIEVRKKDPRGLVVCEGWGQRDTMLRGAFEQAFGTPNEIGSHGALCTVHYASCLTHGAFPIAIVDLEYCEYHITLGRSLGPNFASTGGTRRFARAIDRGMKLVVIDPRCSYEASKGEWVPIRPGSDLAFLLAFAHVMFHEIQRFDEWFLKNRTNAPYLIGPEGDYFVDSESGKPIIWDPVEGEAKPHDADFSDISLTGTVAVNGVDCRPAWDIIREEFLQYTPEWAEEITSVPAAKIRRLANEFVDKARIGSTIQIEGFTFPFRPVSLNVESRVTNHRGGTYADLTGKLINMMVGALEVPGGCLGNGYRGPILEPAEDGVVKPSYEAVPLPFKFPPDFIDGHEFYPNRHTLPHMALKAILNPEKYYHDYRVEAWMSVGGNPIRMNAQPRLWEEAFKKIPFSFSIALHMDEPAILSDVILPEHSSLERFRVDQFDVPHQSVDNECIGLQLIQYREPVPSLFHTKHVDDIITELAERTGILLGEGGLYDHLNHYVHWIMLQDGLNLNEGYKLELSRKLSLEEIVEQQVKGWPYSDGKGLDHLKKHGYIAHWKPRKEFYNYYYFPNNETRHPFYFQHLKSTGDELRNNLIKHGLSFPGIEDPDYILECYRPVPHWVENSEFRAPDEYDLWAINWKTPYYSCDAGNATGNPWLAEIWREDPWDAVACINPVTAEKKGLRDGDWVFIESRYGKVEGRIRVSELFHPDAVGISGNHGMGTAQANPMNRVGPNFNMLLPIDDKTQDGLSGGIEVAPRVKLFKKAVA